MSYSHNNKYIVTGLLTVCLDSQIYLFLRWMWNTVATECDSWTTGNNNINSSSVQESQLYFFINIHRRALPRVWSSPCNTKVAHVLSSLSSRGSCSKSSQPVDQTATRDWYGTYHFKTASIRMISSVRHRTLPPRGYAYGMWAWPHEQRTWRKEWPKLDNCHDCHVYAS